MHPARFAVSLEHRLVQCQLCPHRCRLAPGQTGRCRVRHNRDGRLTTSVYGRLMAMEVEPIEKKRLFHAFPGSRTLSLGAFGCNLRCAYCINWTVSQADAPPGDAPHVPPAALIDQALAADADGIALTYAEPAVFFEYAEDCARAARQAGLYVVAKSNGYLSPPAWDRMTGWLDAVNIDLKGWRPDAHHRATGGHVRVVLDNLRRAVRRGLWVEISTLLAPEAIDVRRDLPEMARFVAGELGPDVPWHLLRFYPSHRLADRTVTPESMLRQAASIARDAGLRYVYTQDAAPRGGLDTVCPACQTVVLRRDACRLAERRLRDGCCSQCGRTIPGAGLEARPGGDNIERAPSRHRGEAETPGTRQVPVPVLSQPQRVPRSQPFRHVTHLPDLMTSEDYGQDNQRKVIRLRLTSTEHGLEILGDSPYPQPLEELLAALEPAVIEKMLCG